MRHIEKMYHIAKMENGVHRTLSENGKSNPRILEYLKSVNDLDEEEKSTEMTPWCASFVTWCCKLAGGDYNTPMARGWLHFGKPITEPSEGDLVIFKRLIDGEDDGVSGHVGYFKAFEGDNVLTYGGNEHNQVGTFPYLRKNVLGFRTSKD